MNFVVEENRCITPNSKDKSIYYLTLTLFNDSDEALGYQPGDWLTIQPQNSPQMVSALLAELDLTGNESIELRRPGLVTVQQALESHLELTQLNPAILNKLQRQLGLGDWADRQAMMDYANGRDILDLLALYPQLKAQGVEFLNWLSPLSPRYYSIASASNEQQTVSILYKAVKYQNLGRQRFGVASNYLQDTQPGQVLQGGLKPNPTFKLPEKASTPIVMIGAGTGLAPFIGFMQHRERQQVAGQDLGEALLFFGETHQQTNCLFCDEFRDWQKQGLVDNFYAFSRDQADKVYVSNRLLEQGDRLWDLLNNQAEFYICGSQAKLAESVKDALMKILQQQGAMSEEQAQNYWRCLKQEKRLQMDVY